jgi:hypothetical protein
MIRKTPETELEVLLSETVQFMMKAWIGECDTRTERGRNSLLQIKGGEQN